MSQKSSLRSESSARYRALRRDSSKTVCVSVHGTVGGLRLRMRARFPAAAGAVSYSSLKFSTREQRYFALRVRPLSCNRSAREVEAGEAF